MYEDITFSTIPDRPFFYTNFVSTVDGRIQVSADPKAYWPIGSKVDYDVLLKLRSHADLLIHGRHTALWYRTVDSLLQPEFRERRKKIKKDGALPYMVITAHPDKTFLPFVSDTGNVPIYILTTESADTDMFKPFNNITVLTCGERSVDLKLLSKILKQNGFDRVLIEGGPRLFASFVSENLMDELFLTIAPKLFGNKDNATLSLIEGVLFEPEHVKQLKLLSVKQVGDEVFLRYGFKH